MQMKIETEELRRNRLVIGTPMYGQQCTAQFHTSVVSLCLHAGKIGVPLTAITRFCSLVTVGRNECCQRFLESDATHLLFIDADIGFSPDAVWQMLALQSESSPYDVLCAPYPRKEIDWRRVFQAARSVSADANPEYLAHIASSPVFNPLRRVETFALDKPFEVKHSGTGFMMIRRRTLERLRDAHPEWRCRWRRKEQMTQFFQAEIDQTTADSDGGAPFYLPEDYNFCRYVRDLGMKVWLCPWVNVSHTGAHTFAGSLCCWHGSDKITVRDVS